MSDFINKLDQICRVCLTEKPLMFSLHHKHESTDISQMLMFCTDIKINFNDNLPQSVCSRCFKRLKLAFVFKEECEKNDKQLRKLTSTNVQICDKIINEITIQLSEDDSSEFSEVNIEETFNVKTEMNLNAEFIENKHDVEEDYSEQESEDGSSDIDCDLLEEKMQVSARIEAKKDNVIKKIDKRKVKKSIIERLYECQTCNKTFKEHRHYWKHREKHLYFSCYVCWEKFSDIETLENHNKEDHKNSMYLCNQENCDIQFSDYHLFTKHKKIDHQIENYLQCSDCRKEFNSHKHWDRHIHIKHLSNPYMCKMCEKCFPTEKKFLIHTTIHPDYFKCTECGTRCKDKKHFDMHTKLHEKSFACEQCSQQFKKKSELTEHINVVHKGLPKNGSKKKNYVYKQPFLCTICGNTFKRPANLRLHLQRHAGDKPFACNYCEYRGTTNQDLTSHLRTHTSARPFICDVCGKGFKASSYLVVHKRYHTNERPYKCSHESCDKAFTNGSDLRAHERYHTRTRLYHCNVCDSSFRTMRYFKIHTKKHNLVVHNNVQPI